MICRWGFGSSSLSCAAITTQHWNHWNVLLRNTKSDRSGIKQMKTSQTKKHKLSLKTTTQGTLSLAIFLLLFYLKLNSKMMKNSRLVVLEYKTLCRKENTTGGTWTACLCLISFPAPVLRRTPLQRGPPPSLISLARLLQKSSSHSTFWSMGSPQETQLRLFTYFMMPWDNRLLISGDPGWIVIENVNQLLHIPESKFPPERGPAIYLFYFL